MPMNMEFKRKLPAPRTVKDMYPVTEEMAQNKREKRPADTGCHHRRGPAADAAHRPLLR